MTASALTWALMGLGIVGMTVWGNVEFCRRRGSPPTAPVVRQDMSDFSPTIHDVDTRPLVEPGCLWMSARTH